MKAVRRAPGIPPTSRIMRPNVRPHRLCTTLISGHRAASSKTRKGNTYSSLQIARTDALSKAHDMIVEGDQKGEDRHDWSFEIMDRANQHVLTVAFSEV